MEQTDPRYAELIARESRLDAEYGRIHIYYLGFPTVRHYVAAAPWSASK